MPHWLHARAEHILAKNPSMPKSEAFAIATQQGHAVNKNPKGYGTAEGKSVAKRKFDTPKDDKKTANPGGLTSPKMASVKEAGIGSAITGAITSAFKPKIPGYAATVAKGRAATGALKATGVETMMARGRNFGGAAVDPTIATRNAAQARALTGGGSGLKLAAMRAELEKMGAFPFMGSAIGGALGAGGGALYANANVPEGQDSTWKDYAGPMVAGGLGGALVGGGAEYGVRRLMAPKAVAPAVGAAPTVAAQIPVTNETQQLAKSLGGNKPLSPDIQAILDKNMGPEAQADMIKKVRGGGTLEF